MKLIPLSKKGKHKGKYFAMVDDEDYEAVSRLHWQAEIGQCCVYANSGSLTLHGFIMNIPTSRAVVVDHIDHNGLNCQRHNLRIATNKQNAYNKRKSTSPSSSTYKGVSKYQYTLRAVYVAMIQHNGESIYLGSFPFEEEAAIAYDEKARELFGEFALTNFAEPRNLDYDAIKKSEQFFIVNRKIKLECQRERVKALSRDGWSQRNIAKIFKTSRIAVKDALGIPRKR